MEGLLRYLMPISLRRTTSGTDEWQAGTVLDFVEGEHLVVSLPLRWRAAPVEAGEMIQAQTAHPEGIRRYSVQVQRRRDVPSPCLFLAWPAGAERIQRREHVRVELMLAATVRYEGASGTPREASGYTTSLSAGGARIVVERATALPASFEIGLDFGDGSHAAYAARLVSSSAGGRGKPWLAVQFTGLAPAERKHLTRVVDEVQREALRRSLR